MKGQTSLFIVLTLVIVTALLSVVVVLQYNGLVKSEKIVDESLAQIATVCQRRLDLIPNLVQTVKGYAQHEQQTLIAVTEARNQAAGALKAAKDGALPKVSELAASQAGLTTAVKGIFALIENYPQLRASSNFMALQDQLEGTENRIAVNRQRYNSATRAYNTKIETFPGVIIAPVFGFNEKEYYEVKDEKAYDSVNVKF